MLAILEEELLWNLAESSSADPSSSMEGLGFSHPPAPLGTSVKLLLQGRPIPFVQFCAAEPTLLLSGHGYQPLVRRIFQIFNVFYIRGGLPLPFLSCFPQLELFLSSSSVHYLVMFIPT